MLKSIHKGSSTILLGVFSSSALSYSAQTANASDISDSSTKADFNASRTDSLSKIAGATAGTVKFIVKDAVVPVISLMFNVLLKVLATLFSTPIPYILFIYICYYNHYVLHKDSKLSWFVNLFSWAPRQFMSILDGDTKNLVTCEELEEQLNNIERSLNDGKCDYGNIVAKLGKLKSKLDVTMGSDDFGKKLRYMLATLMFSSTKGSYEKSKNKIDELYEFLRSKEGIIDFCSRCSDLLNYCLSTKGEAADKVTTKTLKKFFLHQASLPSKEDYGYILGKIKEKMADIKILINEYKVGKEYREDKNAEENYNNLKDLLDVVEAEKKVSETDKLVGNMVGNMDEEEESIMYRYRRLSECVSEIKDHYSECVKELKGRIIVQPLSYLDEVQNYRLMPGIKYFESKSKRMDDLVEKLHKCKEKLGSIVENFKDFKPLKEGKSERDYLFSILNEEIFKNQFGKSEELKSLLSDLPKEDEALHYLVENELEKYKVDLLGSLEFEYRNWKCNALLEYCFGEKIKLKGVVARLKDTPFGGNKNLFLKEELKDILNKIKNKKADIEALINEYGKEECIADKTAEKNYNDLKGLLDVVKAEEKISEIDKIVADIDKEEDEIWFYGNGFSTCYTEIKKLYSDCIEELKKTIQDLPNNYSGEVLKFYLKGKIEYFKNNTERIDALDKALSNCKEKLKSIVENFKDFRPLGEDEEENEYLSLIFYKEILEDKFQKSEEHDLLLNLCNDERSGMYDFVRRELNSYYNALLNNNLKNKYKNWKQKLSVNIKNNWCKTIKGSNNKEKEGDNDKTYGLNEPRDKNNCNKKKRYMRIKLKHKNDNSGNKGTGNKKGIKTPNQEISKEQLHAGDNSLSSTNFDD